MKKLYFLLIVLFFCKGFAQEKVIVADMDKAFALIFSNPKQAKLDLDRLEIRCKKQNDSLYSIILNNKGIYYAVQTQMDSALIYFNKSIALVDGTSKRYVGTQTNIAIIYKKRGNPDKAIILLEANLKIANQKKYNTARATIYGELASCYATKEWYKQALHNVLQSIEIWGHENPVPATKIAIEKQKLGNLYVNMSNMPQALKIFNEIAPVFEKTGDRYNFNLVQVTIANIYIELEQPKKALQLVQNVLPSLNKFNDKELLLFAYNTEAKSIEKIGNKQLALKKYFLAVAFGLKYNQIRTIRTFVQCGDLLLDLKDQKALAFLKKQSEIAVFKNLLPLSSTYEQMRYYQWLEKYAKLIKDKDIEVASKEKAANLKFLLNEKYNFYQVKELQANNSLINLEDSDYKEPNSNQTQLLALFLFIGLGSLTGSIIYKKNENKKAFAQRNLDKKVLDRQLEKQLETQQYQLFVKRQQEMCSKENRLRQDAVAHFAEAFLLFEKETKMVSIPKGDVQQSYILYKKKYLKTIVENLYDINPIFMQGLQSNHPNLTKGEIDFCCLVKLNFSNKEMAYFLNISVESVITKKYRIVKNLQLNKEIDFRLWLATVS